jgi:uncharacterized RDD family membrane protein YckC
MIDTDETQEPGSMNEKSSETGGSKPAGFFSRMMAFVLDLFLLAFLGLMSGLVIFIVLQFFRYGKILEFVGDLLGVDNPIAQFIGLIQPILFLVVLLYFVFFWTFVGYTPGKALLGLRIVRQDGRPLSFGRALLRYLGYWVSAIPLFLGFIWIIFDHQHEGWHDKIANTHVIYKLLE